MQNPTKILKLWNKANDRFGTGKKDKLSSAEKKQLSSKEKIAYKQKERITQGLTILRTVSKGGVKSAGKVKKFEKVRSKTLRFMKRYCKVVKSTKIEAAKELTKYRKIVKQLTVVVDGLIPIQVEDSDDGDLDLNVLAGIDTAKLDSDLDQLEDTGDQDDDEGFDEDELETDEDEEGAEEVEEQQSADTETSAESAAKPDSLADTWKRRREDIEPALKQAFSEQKGDISQMRAVFAFAMEKAAQNDYAKALQGLDSLTKLLKKADSAPAQTGNGSPTNGALKLGPWQTVKRAAVKQVRQLQTEIAKSRHPSAGKVIRHLETIPKLLQKDPATVTDVDSLTKTIQSSPVISKAEAKNPFSVNVKIREALMKALQAAKA